MVSTIEWAGIDANSNAGISASRNAVLVITIWMLRIMNVWLCVVLCVVIDRWLLSCVRFFGVVLIVSWAESCSRPSILGGCRQGGQCF